MSFPRFCKCWGGTYLPSDLIRAIQKEGSLNCLRLLCRAKLQATNDVLSFASFNIITYWMSDGSMSKYFISKRLSPLETFGLVFELDIVLSKWLLSEVQLPMSGYLHNFSLMCFIIKLYSGLRIFLSFLVETQPIVHEIKLSQHESNTRVKVNAAAGFPSFVWKLSARGLVATRFSFLQRKSGSCFIDNKKVIVAGPSKYIVAPTLITLKISCK